MVALGCGSGLGGICRGAGDVLPPAEVLAVTEVCSFY